MAEDEQVVARACEGHVEPTGVADEAKRLTRSIGRATSGGEARRDQNHIPLGALESIDR